ncbi:Glycosyltransferase family 32 protein [Apiospora arundinis]|uniref:Glycosyltransferase family 32 protein n=1 Tax=Apiospora arundinis TaxID=335852 RepID=A0ABR2JN73_9PEZI
MWKQPPFLHKPALRGLVVLGAVFFLFHQLRRLEFGDQIQLLPLYQTPPTSVQMTGEGGITSSPSSSPSTPEISNEIPKKIWFKLGPNGLSDDARKWTDTCIQQNPGYEARFLTDADADAFVNARFAVTRPYIVETYNALTVPILKADLLRYLLLYAEGGVWFDTDASCEGIPIEQWGIVSAGLTNTTMEQRQDARARASLVVGWEFDVGIAYEFQRQFVTWAVVAQKPQIPHLLAVVDDVVASIRETAASQNLTVSQLRMDNIPDVVFFTGPVRFAKSVMRSLGLDKDDEFQKILEPKLAGGDVLILPGYALSASANEYEPKDLDRVGPSLVTHHYAGTWKNDYGGEKKNESN